MAQGKALWLQLPRYSHLHPQNQDESAHGRLVRAAAAWLLKKGCSVVITEMCGGSTETPDAFGWHGSQSVLVECKASRADFLRDRKKIARAISRHAVGDLRYYLCTGPHVIQVADLADRWGLLWSDGDKVMVARKPEMFEDANKRYESQMLLSLVRRIGQNAPSGVSIRCYTIDSDKPRATLTVRKETGIQ